MNLQRRDEIRVIAECPNDMHWAQEMRRAVAELLAHIDTLGSMRSRLCAALGLPADSAPETVAEAVEARRMVVPEPTYDEWRAIAENARSADMVDFLAGAAAYGLWLREHSRAIPMKDLAKLRDDFNEWAISRATGNAEIEHQKADALWKTWCMIEIPGAAETKEKEPLPAVVVPEAYPGQREHVAFLGALKCELENPTPNQKPTSFDINRDYFEHYANVFSKDNERMAHGVGFMNGAEWHRQRFATPADRALGDGMVAVDREKLKDLFDCLYKIACDLEFAGAPKTANTLRDKMDALRANQGGV